MVKNGCGQSGHENLKLTVSQKWIDRMHWRFACWCKFRRTERYATRKASPRGEFYHWLSSPLSLVNLIFLYTCSTEVKSRPNAYFALVLFLFHQFRCVWIFCSERFISIKRFKKWDSRSRFKVLEQNKWKLSLEIKRSEYISAFLHKSTFLSPSLSETILSELT